VSTRLGTVQLPLHSFAGSTKVLLGGGTAKPIRALKVGDRVVAANPATGARSVRKVTRVLVTHDKDLTDVKVLAGGKAAVIGTTAHHLFLDSAAGTWVPAGQLKAGMKLSTVSAAQAAATAVPPVGASAGSLVSGRAGSRVSGSKTVRRGMAAGLLGVGLLVGGGTGGASAASAPALTVSATPTTPTMSSQTPRPSSSTTVRVNP
jgi:hypothetical protein